MGLIQYYQITCQPVNQAVHIFIIMPIVFCNLVSIKNINIIIIFNVITELFPNELIINQNLQFKLIFMNIESTWQKNVRVFFLKLHCIN